MKSPLKILLLGYGKMGKEIEAVALNKGHLIVGKIDGKEGWDALDSTAVDVAIDFSIPGAAIENIQKCIDLNIPLVIGTTGWYDQMKNVEEEVRTKNAAFLWASNFSIGVNILFHLNEKLASVMSDYKDYQPQIHEIHHTQKLDAPSGTAISLARGILTQSNKYQNWQLIEDDQTPQKNQLPITYGREGDVKGTHIVTYENEIDKISLKHEAKTRKGFAVGAVLAAEWLVDKTGFFSMKDVLGI
jgi:4-hydroxy-tetrahydrodipicolinate reductase